MALGTQGHAGRAARYLSAALDREVTVEEVQRRTHSEDVPAGAGERIPLPRPDTDGTPNGCPGPESCVFEVRHPVAGSPATIEARPLAPDEVEREIRRIAQPQSSPKNRFLALWRWLPEELARHVDPAFLRLPADTRLPDHTIWHHNDMAAAFRVSARNGAGHSLLSAHVGPVQSYIATARSLRDLWSGSLIVSWVSWNAMLPVIDRCGPQAIVTPSLRGNPLLDRWLQRQGVCPPEDADGPIPVDASLVPHRFLAVVPCEDVASLADACRSAADAAWRALAADVHARVDEKLRPLCDHWDGRWSDQVSATFRVTVAAVPAKECGEQVIQRLLSCFAPEDGWHARVAAIRSLTEAMPADDRPDGVGQGVGLWQGQNAVLAIQERALREIPSTVPATASVPCPRKCTLDGFSEQMGPDSLDESRDFWSNAAKDLALDAVRLRKGERLGATSMVKRFAVPAHLGRVLGLRNLSFPDTATVAAAQWLHRTGLADCVDRPGWSGRWLGRDRKQDDETAPPPEVERKIAAAVADVRHGRPPLYLAVLAADGDNLGEWLRGEAAPSLEESLHSRVRDYFRELGSAARPGLQARRPVEPARHAAVSAALTRFACTEVPRIVRENQGALVYAGGDDVLAVLPMESALQCAEGLRDAYRSDACLGPRPTISAGIAVVHHMDHLGIAIERAGGALKSAKDAGRDALSVAIATRGAHAESVVCSWETDVKELDAWRRAFQGGVGDRWVYRLRREEEVLGALPPEAVQAELNRQIARSEQEVRSAFGADSEFPAERALDRLSDTRAERFLGTQRPLQVLLRRLQFASFLARGTR